MLRQTLAALLLTATALPALAGKANDTLIYASDSEPENVSPYHNSAREGVILARNAWDTLIYRDPDSGEYKPMLATAWTWIDPVTLDLTIREGVTFHNGDAFSPEDVAFTFNYVLTPEARTVTKGNVDWMKSTEVTGPHTVRIHLKAPFPAALEYLAGPTPIFPAAYFKKVGLDGFAKAPVGTGPYKIVSVDSGRGVKLARFEQYWTSSPIAKPKIGKVEFRVIPDGDSRMAELVTGGIDWIWRVPSDQADQLKSAPGITVLSAETMRVGFLQFDALGRAMEKSPLKDPRVRQAISYAIDRKAMVDNIVRGGSRVMNAACFIGQVGCVDTGVTRYAYDPAKAKALLKEAGYPDGFDIDLAAYRERDYAEAVIGYLRAVGIKARLNYLRYAAFRDALRAGKVSIGFQTWGSFSINDVSAFTGVYFRGGEEDLAKDPQVIAALQAGDTGIDPEARKAKYNEALKRIAAEAYALPMFSYPSNYAFTQDLNFTAQPDEVPRFYAASWK
ncbi:ABC transporter substrate-binding protein [Methylobacterium dankookense]|uniref:Glutathione-binding protein GsiB n=1 Tax=Methylobacterium dankookense TaxID=560405 RepID=A0A564FXU6_9HYPH|nr:ABC transporter substrate-binding protein [Methylobacterium dankookense]GJD54728.1 Glutathione-binding protein GsiB [Methylobacterium dankookense]VUF12596.1 Glutathione-binding protein GsiB [Methylobacterium dankookense]